MLDLSKYKMDPKLAEALEKARHHVMTPKEIYEQKISWIMGQHDFDDPNPPTRDEVKAILARSGCVDPEPALSSK